ncbi:lipid-A-disaccharide synthase [Methylovirgula sp. HY1]|uniref:lipid-A-disaccharide synthase n=1 Tax=Methylovirgula sp. HY1 TaxID=2822761 RepID=UPI001C5AA974|nr:lipid-A-disaccharide synthase [Methylovirgula sp. HY1]QXX73657.1 Lipid-A-disaccharide synthase [Methylovirgula sp. HY1]
MKMRIFLLAGEASGDQLGGALMRSLRLARPDVAFCGVGGSAMADAGLASLYPLEDLAVMGFLPVLRNLPRLLARMNATVAAVLHESPDALVIIDSPDFTHRVASRVRRAMPQLPIVDYVSPTVWAWRSGRARRMRPYIDHVLGLLPFEPDAYRRLGGPACTYVGHPLIERSAELRPSAADLRRRSETPPLLVVLPGSRRSEIERLMPIFAETLQLLAERVGTFEAVLPTLAHLAEDIRAKVASWPVKPRVICDPATKFATFRGAKAALAASGTVTLELALAEVPMSVAYAVSWAEALARPFIKVPSIVLPNLILGENVVPEFLQENCTPEALAAALAALFVDGPERQRQSRAFPRIAERLRLPEGETPSARAVAIVLDTMAHAASLERFSDRMDSPDREENAPNQ